MSITFSGVRSSGRRQASSKLVESGGWGSSTRSWERGQQELDMAIGYQAEGCE